MKAVVYSDFAHTGKGYKNGKIRIWLIRVEGRIVYDMKINGKRVDGFSNHKAALSAANMIEEGQIEYGLLPLGSNR